MSMDATDFITLFLFWVSAYCSEVFAYWTGLSPLLFHLIIGGVLGNLHVVDSHSHTMIFFAEVAITILFFALGFEETVEHFLGGIKKAWGIATIGAAVPFCCGFCLTMFFWPDAGMKSWLMAGLAVTATAVSLTMVTLKSKGLAVSKAAIGIMTSAVLDDVMCLALVAIMVPICTGQAEPSVLGIGWILMKSVIFFSVIIVMNVAILPHDIQTPILRNIPLLRTYGINHFLRFRKGEQAVLVVLMTGLGVGLIAVVLGFHPAIGAYMAGLIFKEKQFDLFTDSGEPDGNVFEHVKEIVENAAFCWMGPIFFLHLGSGIVIDGDLFVKVIFQAVVIFIVLGLGQFFSAALAARFVPGGFTWAQSWMIGFGMLGRAELFFVVLNVCYNDYKIFNDEIFFALTLAAVLLNFAVPVTISLYKPYYTGAKSLCGSGEGSGKTSEEALQEELEVMAQDTETLTLLYYTEKAMKREKFEARRQMVTDKEDGLDDLRKLIGGAVADERVVHPKALSAKPKTVEPPSPDKKPKKDTPDQFSSTVPTGPGPDTVASV